MVTIPNGGIPKAVGACVIIASVAAVGFGCGRHLPPGDRGQAPAPMSQTWRPHVTTLSQMFDVKVTPGKKPGEAMLEVAERIHTDAFWKTVSFSVSVYTTERRYQRLQVRIVSQTAPIEREPIPMGSPPKRQAALQEPTQTTMVHITAGGIPAGYHNVVPTVTVTIGPSADLTRAPLKVKLHPGMMNAIVRPDGAVDLKDHVAAPGWH